MNERDDGWRELACSKCGLAYGVLNPNYDEATFPLCLACRPPLTFEVVDISKVDRKFMTPDLSKIQKLVDSMKEE